MTLVGSEPTVWLASYKGPAEGLLYNTTHQVIKRVTRSIYSHSEAVILGKGYSSSERDGGVRKKDINFRDGKWDYIPVPWVKAADVLGLYNRTDGDDYDFWGLRLFLGIDAPEDEKKWWCSEWVATAFQMPDTRISPGELHKVAQERYFGWMAAQGAGYDSKFFRPVQGHNL